MLHNNITENRKSGNVEVESPMCHILHKWIKPQPQGHQFYVSHFEKAFPSLIFFKVESSLLVPLPKNYFPGKLYTQVNYQKKKSSHMLSY